MTRYLILIGFKKEVSSKPQDPRLILGELVVGLGDALKKLARQVLVVQPAAISGRL